jgi:LacI family transcriptional regulator, repressor for deo operon, udp, cdd, tsx, nupC, and nupG
VAKSGLSIKDIARAANVSHSTVSRALRNSPLVNFETAEQIRKIARDANFRISAVARSLATGRTNTVGVVVTTIADPFAAEVVQGIEEAANARGYSVILANSGANPEREMKVVHSFEERRVDGILVTSSRVGNLYVPHLAEMKVPIVLINNQHPEEFVYSVMIDNVAASEEATRHLIQLGHRRIAYLGDRGGFQSESERCQGYKNALAAANLPCPPELVRQADSTPDGAMQVVDDLLALKQPPTALFCYNDISAVGALLAARRHGLDVPNDLSVMGFDDLPLASYLCPTLTTIRQPMREMGRQATGILFHLLDGGTTENSRRVQGELIVRESTAAPRTSE